jgi:hypothetical protein
MVPRLNPAPLDVRFWRGGGGGGQRMISMVPALRCGFHIRWPLSSATRDHGRARLVRREDGVERGPAHDALSDTPNRLLRGLASRNAKEIATRCCCSAPCTGCMVSRALRALRERPQSLDVLRPEPLRCTHVHGHPSGHDPESSIVWRPARHVRCSSVWMRHDQTWVRSNTCPMTTRARPALRNRGVREVVRGLLSLIR